MSRDYLDARACGIRALIAADGSTARTLRPSQSRKAAVNAPVLAPMPAMVMSGEGASFLVLPDPAEGQDIAGFLFSLEHHDSTGTSEGSRHCLGTRKPWRRRSLATTLVGHALAA